MAESRRRGSVAQSFLTDLLDGQLADWLTGDHRPGASVVDIGGGTGGLAVALATRGHMITVVDPSPDALAALQRRAAEADLTDYITGLQGDTADLSSLFGASSVDVVLCHRVLELLPDPRQALADIAEVLDQRGALSLLVAQRHPVVLSQAVAGDFAHARRTWADPHLLDRARVVDLLTGAGWTVQDVHGIGAVSEQVPERHLERPDRFEELLRLEREVSQDPAFASLAPWVHVFAIRG
ncbi:methyltransferase domain-containing protein [Auraticoccus monumenti]|uniref:Methyltransferase domain-containing protein n=1 Tax=Auraticoccus monumenti TaxID=675864 RepID=A0A1G7DNS9_9ACTN|nr:methyltransferase domain-containing protein [Auraticoccus monumenti]SDE53183.1 Methyltransferase domain-containing protein [Auraticoccus monumenti]